MRKESLVSICTPVFNGENFIENCIKSVLSQTYRNFEYTIIDNASTDKTPWILEKYQKKDSFYRLLYSSKSSLELIYRDLLADLSLLPEYFVKLMKAAQSTS